MTILVIVLGEKLTSTITALVGTGLFAGHILVAVEASETGRLSSLIKELNPGLVIAELSMWGCSGAASLRDDFRFAQPETKFLAICEEDECSYARIRNISTILRPLDVERMRLVIPAYLK
jgi:hypothetical protein